MYKSFRFFILGLIAVVVFFSTNAFASTGTNQYPQRGEGVGMISGYEITNVYYQLGENPSTLNAVEMDLDSAAREVVINFDSVSHQNYFCHNTAQFHWVCRVDNINVSQITQLRVSAHN
jgi:hypothetical protein